MPGRPKTRLRIMVQHLSNLKAAYTWLQRKAPPVHGKGSDEDPYLQSWSLALKSTQTAIADLDELAEEACRRFGLVRHDALDAELVSIGTDVRSLADWCNAVGTSPELALTRRKNGWTWERSIFLGENAGPGSPPPIAPLPTGEVSDDEDDEEGGEG